MPLKLPIGMDDDYRPADLDGVIDRVPRPAPTVPTGRTGQENVAAIYYLAVAVVVRLWRMF